MAKHSKPGARVLPLGLVILHEDRDLLVVDKPAGLLTIATDRDRERTAYYILTDYVRKGAAKSRNRVFIVHRLDRETSGVLVFAKSEEAKRRLQDGWEETEKKYLAIVQGHLAKPEDTITSYLAENEKSLLVYATSDPTRGKLCKTAYRVLKETKDFSLLEVTLLTGRKHQIRVHMAGLGHPVVGDKKYGKGGGAHKQLALHAWSLSFRHPHSGQPLTFTARPPRPFTALVGGFGEATTATTPAEPAESGPEDGNANE